MSKDDGLQAALDNHTGPAEILRFYNGEVELRYIHAIHAYYIEEDGKRFLVPGVTTVDGTLDKSGPLTQWAANETCNWIRAWFAPAYKKARRYTNGRFCYGDLVIPVEGFESLLNDARFNYRTISKTATDIGQLAHEWLENRINKVLSLGAVVANNDGLALPANNAACNCIEAALGWFGKHNFRPLHSERKIYSRKYNYSGTLDWIGHITSCGDPACCPFSGTVLALGDFKSSKAIYDEYRLQLAAYQAAWEEEFPDQPIDVRILMRLDKEGDGIETLVMSGGDEFFNDLDGFLGLLQTYNWQKQLDFDRKYDKAVLKAEKKAAKEAEKAAIKALKPPRKPSKKAQIKGFEPIPTEIPTEVST